ncbi:MAG: O-antigen ligase family protein, partial [Acidobacteriota bacterium]
RLPKLVVAELLALVSIAALALRLVACRRLNWRVFITAPAVLAGLPLVAWATLGLALTEHPQLVASRLPSLWIGLAALWAWSSFLSSERRWMLLRWTIVPAVVLAVFGIAQFHGFSPFVFSGKVTDRLAVTSLAGGAFDLSAFLILPILIAQHALAVGRRLLPRLLWLVALAVCAYALVATQTLGSLGAVIVGSMVFWIAGAATGRSARRGLVAVAVALAVALAAVATVGPLRARAEGKVRSLRVGDFDRVFTGRFDGWRTAAWMIREEPIHGVGHGAFRAEFGRAKEALVEDGVGFFRGQHLVFFENAHSEPLEVAAELGLVGLLALGWGFVSLLRRLRLWRLRRSRIPERSEDEEGDSSPVDGVSGVDVESAAFGRGSRDDRRLAALELAAWVAILLVALIDFPFHLALLAFPWLLLASDTLRISDDPMDRLQASGSAPGRTVPGWVAATAMVLVLTLALGLRFGVLRDRLRADGLVNAVETRTVQASQAGTVTALLLQQHLDILR